MIVKTMLHIVLCAYFIMPFLVVAASNDAIVKTETTRDDHQDMPVVAANYSESHASVSLQSFIEDIWLSSPRVQNAQAKLDAARAREKGASQPLHNPVLELDIENADSNTRSIGINQKIDLSGRRDALVSIASNNTVSAQLNLYRVKRGIVVDTLSALIDYFTNREMQTVALQRSKFMLDFLDTVKQRYKSGDIDQLDVTYAQVAYSEALITQATIASHLAEAESALIAISGSFKNHWPSLPQQLAEPPGKADLSLIESLPELELLRSRMETAQARISLARRETQADPIIGVRAGSEESDVLLGLSIELPLFVRNNYKSLIRAASYDAVSQEQAYRQAYQQAKAQLVGSLGRFQHTSQAWNSWLDQGKDAHIEQKRLLDAIWQAGELSATDFLIQAKQNTDTLAAATQLKGEVWKSFLAWLQNSGQIETWLGLQANASVK